MYSRSAATAYRRADLEAAPSYQIVDRLYERFARDGERARAAIVAKDIQVTARDLDHAICIVVQLKLALDHKAAPEMCANLEPLYDIEMARISEANLSHQVMPLDQAAMIMAELATAFLLAPR